METGAMEGTKTAQPGTKSGIPRQSGAAVSARRAMREPLTDDALIRVQARAIHAICGQLTAGQLEELRSSVEQACLMPKRIGWDLKAKAHAEMFGLLAEAADHPVLAQTLNSGAGLVHHLMMTAGPTAAMITANSRKRLLALLSADDPEGAAHELERHLMALRFIGRLTACPPPSATAR
jgi:DNA-binding GntR family transcriptional regulator